MREAAAVMQCQNHFKQLGIAAYNYHDTHNAFPAGTVRGSAEKVEDRLSLFVLLLPYLEQENRSRQIDHSQGWKAGTNAPFTAVPIKLFQCPDGEVTEPVTHVVGMAGLGADAARLGDSHPRRGVFGYDRATAIKDVKDGTHVTMLFIETTRDVGPWAAGGAATVRGLDPDDTPVIGKDGAFGRQRAMSSSFNFGRVKPSAVVALTDGSVRRVQADVSVDVLSALATVAGGESVPDGW